MNGKAVIIPNALGKSLTPSCISLMEDGTIAVGEAARDRLSFAPLIGKANSPLAAAQCLQNMIMISLLLGLLEQTFAWLKRCLARGSHGVDREKRTPLGQPEAMARPDCAWDGTGRAGFGA